jgi:exo-1,4-beta-D-glucosaminidase
MAKTPQQTDLLASYLADQVRWLRHHPSIFAWVLGSDKLPYPSAEKRYRDDLAVFDPTRPILASCKAWRSEVSGPTGVKMAGPYDYVTPNYWYEDRANGGAFGFNTETGPGPQVPPLSSLKRMIPADQLWPINPAWDYHCARHAFGNLNKFLTAYDQRYGPARSVEEFTFKAQAANYEAMRAMFEAFSVNKPTATGVVQWMLNGAWPKMFWQLYDYYLMPSGAFYGARQGCQPVNAIYHYGNRAVYLTNDTLANIPAVTLHTRLYSQDSKIVFQHDSKLACPENSTTEALILPPLGQDGTVYFLDLSVTGPNGVMARNFYWLSAKPDVLDPAKGDWTWMPNKTFADFTALGTLPIAPVTLTTEFRPGDKAECLVKLTNQSDKIAFFIELQLVRDKTGEPVLPVLWDDNYVSLLPHESRTLKARYAPADLGGEKPKVVVQGWNIEVMP